jgi:hypothetical protein
VEALKIEVDARPDRITIHTKQPETWLGWKKDSATADYILQVPQHARLAGISSVNGPVVIDGVSGSIEASSVNGPVEVRGAVGDLKLSTVNGHLEAQMVSLRSGQSVSLEAVNGHLEAILPANANADVTADTLNGGLTSEFSSLVVKKEFPVGRRLRGTLGSGGAHVKASTVNGGINFRKGGEALDRDSNRSPNRRDQTPPASPQELAARAEAARAITATDKRDAALVVLAKDAATAGDFALVKRTLSQITMYDTHDTATYEAAGTLARADRRADAIDIAKTIISGSKRDAALRELAE